MTLRKHGSTTHEAEKVLKEFAEIHTNNDNEKYKDGSKRILLTMTTNSLFAAAVLSQRLL